MPFSLIDGAIGSSSPSRAAWRAGAGIARRKPLSLSSASPLPVILSERSESKDLIFLHPSAWSLAAFASSVGMKGRISENNIVQNFTFYLLHFTFGRDPFDCAGATVLPRSAQGEMAGRGARGGHFAEGRRRLFLPSPSGEGVGEADGRGAFASFWSSRAA